MKVGIYFFYYNSGKPAKLEDKENPDRAPNSKLGYVNHRLPTTKCSMGRHERLVKCQRVDGDVEIKTVKECDELNNVIVQTDTFMKDMK